MVFIYMILFWGLAGADQIVLLLIKDERAISHTLLWGLQNTNILGLVTVAGFVTPKEILVNHGRGRCNLAPLWGNLTMDPRRGATCVS